DGAGAFSDSASRHAAADQQGRVLVYDLDQGKALFQAPDAGKIEAVDLSADGSRVAAIFTQQPGSVQVLKVWDVDTGRELLSTAIRDKNAARVTKDGAIVVSRPRPPHLSRDGKRVAVIASDHATVFVAKVWDVDDGQLLRIVPHAKR